MSKKKTAAVTAEPRLLIDVFRDQYQPLRLMDGSEGCLRQYRLNLAKLSVFLEHPATLADLNEITISRFLASLRDRKLSPATTNKIRSQIVALWNFAAKKKLVDEFPDIRKLKEYRREPTTWTVEELSALWATCDRLQGDVCGIEAAYWWRGILMTVYDTGVRIGALRQTRLADFNAATRKLVVRAENQKQKADQTFTLHPETCAVLAKMAGERELLFPWVLTFHSLYNHFSRLLRAAGLPAGRRDKFHKIRRTTATFVAMASTPAAATQLLGHSSSEVTEAYLNRSIMPGNNASEMVPRPHMRAPVKGEQSIIYPAPPGRQPGKA